MSNLEHYFSKVWKSNMAQYQYSGAALVQKINLTETILDVGRGFNQFKPFFAIG